MNRAEFNSCIRDKIKSGELGHLSQRRRFCASAKICSGRASDVAEATAQCQQPSGKPGRKAKAETGGMKVVLLTSTGCDPCNDAKRDLKERIERGEIKVLDIQKSDDAAILAQRYKLYSVPKLLVLDSQGEPFSELEVFDRAETIDLTELAKRANISKNPPTLSQGQEGGNTDQKRS